MGKAMRLRRVTVLGGAGFLGRYVVKRLAAQGVIVSVVSRHASDAGFLRPMGDVGQIALIDAGLSDKARLAAALAGADAAISLAGTLHESGGQRFDLVHHQGPAGFAALAAAAGVKRFVHVSSIGADAASRSTYARSKAAGP
jgi:uncharacterized protein YbjT (DUF2867 family)